MNFRESWELVIHATDNAFFSSDEAQLIAPGRKVKLVNGMARAMAYKGLNVHENNNLDVAYCFRNSFNSCKSDAQADTFSNFKVCIGQLARFGVATGRLHMNTLWNAGQFFKICEQDLVFHVFLGHFQQKSTSSTVMNKAAQLYKFVHSAVTYFDANPLFGDDVSKNKVMRGRAVEIMGFLRRTSSAEKRESRRLKTITKEDDYRRSINTNITEETYCYLRERAVEELIEMVKNVEIHIERKRAVDIKNRYKVFELLALARTGFVSKWCLNFLACLLLYGNGQRNQVYTALESPSLAELDEFKKMQGGSSAKVPLKIRIRDSEKRPRDCRLPFVMFDPKIFNLVHFHVEFIRPYVLNKVYEDGKEAERERLEAMGQTDMSEIDDALFVKDAKELLLDTRNANPVYSDSIRKSLARWTAAKDPELRVTPMSLRAFIATYHIRSFVNKSSDLNPAFKNLSVEDFKEVLAAVMNTSIAMINSVYAAATHTEYANHVAMTMGIVSESEYGDGSSESVEEDRRYGGFAVAPYRKRPRSYGRSSDSDYEPRDSSDGY